MSLSNKTVLVAGWAAVLHTLRPDGDIVVAGRSTVLPTVHTLRHDAPAPTPLADSYPDCLSQYEEVGKCADFCLAADSVNSSQIFKVTGYQDENQPLAGVYGGNSSFWVGGSWEEACVDEAVVFMGYLKANETGLIRLTCAETPAIFPNVVKNGVTTQVRIANATDKAFTIEKYVDSNSVHSSPPPVPAPIPDPGPSSFLAPAKLPQRAAENVTSAQLDRGIVGPWEMLRFAIGSMLIIGAVMYFGERKQNRDAAERQPLLV